MTNDIVYNIIFNKFVDLYIILSLVTFIVSMIRLMVSSLKRRRDDYLDALFVPIVVTICLFAIGTVVVVRYG